MNKSRGEKWREQMRLKAMYLGRSGMPIAADLLHRDIIKDARIEAAQTTNKEEPE